MARNDQSSCCSGSSHEHHEHQEFTVHGEKLRNGSASDVDVEQGAGLEQVSLSVEGMTCSGCGNKMERTLNSLPGVSRVRVNFVMGSAEFSVSRGVSKVEDVVRSAERATGFRCTRISGEDQVLDVLASGENAKALLRLDALGVNKTTLDNKIVRIAYDPAVIGGRSLLRRINHLCEGLAPPRADPSIATGRRRMYNQLAKTVLSAALTIPVCVFEWGDVVDQRPGQIASLVLATLVQLIAVPDFYRPALSALIFSRTIEMDMLVVISITAAYAYSVVAFAFLMVGRPLETETFFETSTLLVTLVLLGRLVAAFARIRAVEAVSLRSLQASTATVVEDGNDREIDTRLLQFGDKFKVLPHTIVPTDGVVTRGTSELDESMLTGESAPVPKQQGDSVIAGTVNGSGTLVARLTRLPGKNTVTDIADLVEEAANLKPKLQQTADKVASWFVPIVTTIAVVVVIVWLVVGFKVRNHATGKSISNAITYAVATLAISCPCALGLAVPMVLVVAGGIAARGGVIIKSAECTERARKVTDVVFDKTGTVTEGSLDVVEEQFLGEDPIETIGIAKALVSGNRHPVSVAVARHLEQYDCGEVEVIDQHVLSGAGIQGAFHDIKVLAGNPRWTETENHPTVESFRRDGMTVLVVTRSARPIAIFGLRASLRLETLAVIANLHRRNITTHLVSGDQKLAVHDIASHTGITNVEAEQTPSQKRDYVAKLMAAGGKTVMFVGDGTNDAVAVTQADVGVQLAGDLSASDVTRGAADVILLNGLEGIPFLLDVSASSYRRMVFNFAWSAAYNVVAILFASGALVRVRIPPAYAGLGEIVSVLPVIVAAATMLVTRVHVAK